MRKSGLWAVAACLVAMAAGPALASGFSVYEQSAKASGQAGAWVARADDAAACWYNPAAMVHLDGMQVQFGMNLITIGSDTDFTIDDPYWAAVAGALGVSADAGTKFASETNNVTPIHFYFTQKVNDRVAWGIGINNPIGLVTEWSDIPITLSHRRAELVTFVVNPNVAFKFNDKWSGSVGLDYMMADVKEFSRLVLFGETLGTSDLTGDGDDWGWNIALHYDGGPWSFGFSYRAEMSPEIEGDMRFTGLPESLGEGIPGFVDTPGKATLDLPAQAAIGAAWDVAEGWEMEFDISWAGWSSFEALAIDVANETAVVFDQMLVENWDDTMCFRLGAAWDMAEQHQLRFGLLYDQSPVPKDTLRPSIPDADRWAPTFGYGYKGEKWDIDAYYMPLFFKDITAVGDPANKPGMTLLPDGVIDGKYSSFVHLLGVTFNVRF